MPEIKQTFLKGKMNKSLNDRLLPEGEYRDALNIQVSETDTDDVGLVQNIKGNLLVHDSGLVNAEVIGSIFDDKNNRVFYFVVDDNGSYIYSYIKREVSESIYGYLSSYSFDLGFNVGPNETLVYNDDTLLVHGVDYLFSKTEQKINFTIPTAINVITIKTVPAPIVSGSFLNFSKDHLITGVNIIEDLLFWTDNLNEPRRINLETAITDPDYYNSADKITVAKYSPHQAPLMSLFKDPSVESNYMEDKFLRFSYRFKFKEGEYSQLAPFTQTAFVAKNKTLSATDVESAYKESILKDFINDCNKVELSIPLPANAYEQFEIREVEVLVKDSASNAVRVVSNIDVSETDTNISYTYKSEQPYLTIAEEQVVRVSENIPTKALAQEVSGNRIIYGNFFTTQSGPRSLDYNVAYADKTSVLGVSEKEYPNHTLKQNRNYQVGFVLADRFGRQSSVILSSNDVSVDDGGITYGGSTIYVPYKPNSGTSALNWPGYALRTIINSPIPTKEQYSRNGSGYAGIYKDPNYGADSIVKNATGTGYSTGNGISTSGGTGTGLTVDILTAFAGKVGDIKISNSGTGYTDGDIITVDGGNNDCELTITVLPPNPTGWYSYKIVVKQKEQEYYNVYLPGILNGYPYSYVDSATGTNNPTFEQGETSNIVLFNDNINKIPKDLDQVGPDTTQYRSAERLFGRVAPINNNNYNYNQQYYPGIIGDTVTAISTLSEANYNDTTASGADPTNFDINYPEFYQSNTNPSIARLKVQNQIGKSAPDPTITQYQNTLAVYETDPRESLLDIYWETTSSGLISNLNNAIIEGGFEGAVQTNGYTFTLNESTAPGSNAFSGIISVVNGFANVIVDDITFTLLSVYDATNTNRTEEFWLEGHPGSGTVADPKGFRIKTKSIAGGQDRDSYFYYGTNSAVRTFNMLVKCVYTDPVSSEVFTTTVALTDLALGNTPPTFITSIACPATIINVPQPPSTPIASVTVPRTFNANGTVVYTFYAQNGSKCEGDNYTNELSFGELSGNLLPSMFELRTDENNPGVCELVMLPYEVDGSETFNCYVRLADAGANIKAYAEITITEVPTVTVSIATTGTCSPSGNWYNGNVREGDLRFRATFENLNPSTTYNVTYSFYDSVNATGSNAPGACGIPSSFVASAATEYYYFDINWTSASGNPRQSISITITDAAEESTNTYSSIIYNTSQPPAPLSQCPVGLPCV